MILLLGSGTQRWEQRSGLPPWDICSVTHVATFAAVSLYVIAADITHMDLP